METILLPDFTLKRPVPVASIEYLEAKGNYTWVHITRNKPLLVAITLKQMARRLPTFLRLHKSLLVNPGCILAYRAHLADPPFVQLSRERRLPISRRQHKQLRHRLAAYERLSSPAA
ncbi:LytR/AlgR family response regulator transcription factor [Spirosoma pulveris]